MSTGQTFHNALVRVTVTEVEALAGVLEVPLSQTSSGLLDKSAQEQLWRALSYLGSNDIAYLLRGLEGVDYPEIVRDTCAKAGVKATRDGDTQEAVEHNEVELVKKLFDAMWEQMTPAEQQALMDGLGESYANFRGKAGFLIAAQLVARLGGFGTYQLALLVANTVARAVLGRGLAFGANAALTRTLGALVGPIGWIASGAWLAYDLASPAYRKTLPAVVQVAALRQLTRQRQIIGIMGHGSTGKDSLLKFVFGVDTNQVDPIPGATSSVKLYDAKDTKVPTRVMNFPGFGDLRPDVEREIAEQAKACSSIIYLFDRIPQEPERKAYEEYAKVPGIPSIVLFNKWDKLDEDEKDVTFSETCKRLGRTDLLPTSLKRKPGNSLFEDSKRDIRASIDNLYASRGHAKPFEGSEGSR